MSCTVYFLLPLQGGTVSSSENVLFQYLQFVFFVLIFLRESNLSPLSPTSFTNFFFTASCFPRQLLIGVTHTGCFFFSGPGCMCFPEFILEKMSTCLRHKHILSCNHAENRTDHEKRKMNVFWWISHPDMENKRLTCIRERELCIGKVDVFCG